MTRAEVPSGPDLPRAGGFAAAAAGAAATPAASAEAPAQGNALAGFSPSDARTQARAAAASAAEALPRVSSRKSRMVAVLELIAGLAVFGLGLQLDNTVLHGNADTIWLVLHGFALYGIGAGLYGLRP